MNKIKKFFAILIVILFAIIGGGIFYLNGNMDAINNLIVTNVEKYTGKKFTLEKTSLSIFPNLGLNLTNGAWGTPDTDDLSVEFETVNVSVQLIPLIKKEIKINAINLVSPTIIYNTNLTTPKAETAVVEEQAEQVEDVIDNSSTMAMVETLQLKRFSLENANITYIDATQTAKLNDFSFSIDDFQFNKDATFKFATGVDYNGSISAKTSLSLEGSINVGDTVYKLSNLKGTIDDTNYNGFVTVELPSDAPMVVDTDLSFDSIDANKYYPFQSNEVASTGAKEESKSSSESSGLALPTVTAKIAIGKLKYDAYNISNFKMNVNTAESKVTVSQLEGKLDDTAFNMVASVNMPANKPMEIDTEINIGKINVNKYLSGGEESTEEETPSEEPATKTNNRNKPLSLPTVNAKLAVSELQYDAYNLSNFKFNLATKGSNINISEFKGKLDDTTFDVVASLSKPTSAPAVISSKVSIDKIDVNKYMPKSTGEEAEEVTTTEPAKSSSSNKEIVLPTVTFELAMGQVIYDIYDVKNIVTTIKTKGDTVDINPAKFNIYDSNMSFIINSRLNSMQHKVTANMPNLNIGDVMQDFMDMDTVLGHLNIYSELSFTGLDTASIFKTLGNNTTINGNVEVDTKVIPELLMTVLKKRDADLSKINFSKVDIKSTGTNGVINFSKLDFYSAIANVDGSGSVNLVNDKLDLVLNTKIGSTTIPLGVTGTLSDMKYGLAGEPVKSAVKETVNQVKEETKTQVKEEVKNIIQGKDPKESLQDLEEKGKDLIQDAGKGLFDKLKF